MTILLSPPVCRRLSARVAVLTRGSRGCLGADVTQDSNPPSPLPRPSRRLMHDSPSHCPFKAALLNSSFVYFFMRFSVFFNKYLSTISFRLSLSQELVSCLRDIIVILRAQCQ